jgi:hypothetical protein
MATEHDGARGPGRFALSFGNTGKGRASMLALFAAVLFAAAPAEARHKKKPDPPPQPAPSVAEPAPAPAASAPASAAPSASKPAAAAEPEPAPSGPAITVVGVSLDLQGASEAALQAYLAENAVRRAGRQALQPLEDLLDPAGAAAREKGAKDGDRALKAAKNAYFNDLDLDTASALCDKAYAGYLKSDLPRNFNKLVEASELKIAAMAADPKQADRARAELGLLLPIDPRSELSPNLFNPETIKQAEAMRAQLRSQSTLSLQVKTGAVPARVFLDGAFRGVSPVTVKNLPPGAHLLTLVAPGYQRVQKKVNPGPEPTVDAALEPVEGAGGIAPKLDAIKKTFRSEQLPKSLAALGSWLKVEQVLLVAAEAGPGPGSREVAAVRTEVTPATLQADLDASYPGDGAKAASVVDSLATQAVTTDHLLRGHRAPLEASSGGGSEGARYAGYGLIGGGVVAAGLGTYFGLAAKSQQSTFRGLAQTSPSATSVANSGKSDALIANVAFGTAIVAAGVGVALVILNHSSGEPAETHEDVVPPPRAASKPAESRKPEPRSPAGEASRPAEAKKPEPKSPAGEASRPAEPKPAEPKPTEVKPAAAKPEPKPEPKPAETRPAEVKKPTPSEPPPAPEAKPQPKPPEEPAKSAEPPPPPPKPKEEAPAAAPDAGSPDSTKTKPPKDLGEDIRD